MKWTELMYGLAIVSAVIFLATAITIINRDINCIEVENGELICI